MTRVLLDNLQAAARLFLYAIGAGLLASLLNFTMGAGSAGLSASNMWRDDTLSGDDLTSEEMTNLIVERRYWLGGVGIEEEEPVVEEPEVIEEPEPEAGERDYVLVGTLISGPDLYAYLLVGKAAFQAVREGQVLENGDVIESVNKGRVRIRSEELDTHFDIGLYADVTNDQSADEE